MLLKWSLGSDSGVEWNSEHFSTVQFEEKSVPMHTPAVRENLQSDDRPLTAAGNSGHSPGDQEGVGDWSGIVITGTSRAIRMLLFWGYSEGLGFVHAASSICTYAQHTHGGHLESRRGLRTRQPTAHTNKQRGKGADLESTNKKTVAAISANRCRITRSTDPIQSSTNVKQGQGSTQSTAIRMRRGAKNAGTVSRFGIAHSGRRVLFEGLNQKDGRRSAR